MSNPRSVLIVGGGIIGLCSAWYAAKDGHKVTIAERGAGPDHDACSRGNAGMIVPSHFVPLAAPGMVGMGLRMLLDPESPFALRPRASRELIDWGLKFWRACTPEHVTRSAPLLRDLNLESRRLYVELAEELGNDFLLETRGLLMLCKTEHALEDERKLAQRAVALGVPAEALTPEATAKLDPGITMDIAGSVYFPKDCHLAPQRLIARLTRALTEAGVTFRYGTEITDWQIDTNGAVTAARTATGETLEADEFVIAGGSWTPRAATGLDLRLPLQAGKGYSMTLERPRELPGLCSILTEARVAVTPMGGALRIGGTMELTGLDTSVNAARVRGIIKSVPRYFPKFSESDFTDQPVWTGLRPCSPDGLPYLGRPSRLRNVLIATGHAMMGLSLGPITGRLVTDLLGNTIPAIDLTLLSPDRYDSCT